MPDVPDRPADLGAVDLGPADLVIEDTTVLQHGTDGAISFLDHATVTVRGTMISAIEQHVPAGSIPTLDRIDGRGQVTMPGLSNCHTHASMVIFRGAAEDVDPHAWFNDKIWPMEVNLTPRDVGLGARLAVAEMISGGVTNFADHYFAMDEVASVVESSGIRANLGWCYFSSEGEEGFRRGLDFAQHYQHAAGGRITTSLAPHADYDVTDDDLRRTGEVAREHDLLVHIHAGESRIQTRQTRARRGDTPIGVLHHTGLLEGRVLIAHGRGIVPDDVPLLLNATGQIGVGSAPKGYLKDGFETTPIRLLDAAGVPVGLATDGAASNNTLDVWEAMMVTALVQKATELDEKWMTASKALQHATLLGAKALGLESETGSLAVGKKADIILVDLRGPHTQPIHDLAATLVFSARSADISHTIVDGRVLMRDRRLLTVDYADLIAELTERLPALTDTSHGRKIQDYEFG